MSRKMKVKERTGFSFFTLVSFSNPDESWPDWNEDREGYEQADSKWYDAIQESLEKQGCLQGGDEPTALAEAIDRAYGKYDCAVPPSGTPERADYQMWIDCLENTGAWGRHYRDYPSGAILRSFCHVSKGKVPFFLHQPYDMHPTGYFVTEDLNWLQSPPIPPYSSKGEIKQYNEVIDFLRQHNVFELEDAINPARLGLNPPDEIEIGRDKPYFIGRREDGRGSFFYYKGGVYIADEDSDVVTYVDGTGSPDDEGPPNEYERGHISDELESRVYQKCNNVCQADYRLDSSIEKGEICGSNLDLHMDHIRPVSKGGTSTFRNLQLLCEKHNLMKSNKLIR